MLADGEQRLGLGPLAREALGVDVLHQAKVGEKRGEQAPFQRRRRIGGRTARRSPRKGWPPRQLQQTGDVAFSHARELRDFVDELQPQRRRGDFLDLRLGQRHQARAPLGSRQVVVGAQLRKEELRQRLGSPYTRFKYVFSILSYKTIWILAVWQEQEPDRLVVGCERQAHFEGAPCCLAARGVAVEAEHQL